MLLVGTSSTVTLSGANVNKQSIELRGMPSGTILRRLVVELKATITRAAGALNHQPEEMSQLISALTLRKAQQAPKSFKPDIVGINGRVFDVMFRFMYATRNNDNRVSLAADTEIVHHWEIPLTPNFTKDLEKRARPLSDYLEGGNIDIVSTLSDFDTTLVTGDITGLSGVFSVYAQVEAVPGNYRPYKGGIVLQQNEDFINSTKQHFRDFNPSLVFLRTRTAYDQLSLRSNLTQYYANLDPLEIEQMQSEQRFYPHNENRTTFQGDPLAQNVPIINAGVPATESGVVALDARNMKDVIVPLEFQLHNRTAPVPWYAMGWLQ